MKRRRRRRKTNINFFIFLSLFTLFFTLYFTILAFSRYTNSFNINNNFSVAKWDVSMVGEDNKELPTMFIGNTDTYQSYELSVTSKSEIAIKYSAVISNVPTGVKVQVDDNVIYNESKNTIKIPDLGSFNARDINNTHNHKLTIIVPFGIDSFTNKKLDIDVIFTQVDL